MKLNELTLHELVSGIQSNQFSSKDVTLDCIQQIHQVDDRILAWEWFNPDHAIEKAELTDRVMRSHSKPKPLQGIPIGIKDIIATKSIPTTMGSPIYADFIPDQSATVMQMIEAAGGFCFGKTVTTEFAWRKPGKTRNPWNPNYTPGGSSSGSAAAVAANCVPAALGTQTVGSVIRPAAYCGVVGYKPSYGLISRDGVHPFSPTLDHVGLFTRSVVDASLLMSCLTGTDRTGQGDSSPTEWRSDLNPLPPQAIPTSPRIAAVRTPMWNQASSYQQQHFIQCLTALEQAGAMIDEVELSALFAGIHAINMTIMAAEAAQIYQPLRENHPGNTSEMINELIEQGLAINAVSYLNALATRSLMQQALADILSTVDAIVTIPATGEAPHGLDYTGDAIFCEIWTLCGVPAITIPTGWGPNNLPLGFQVIGSHGKDAKALQMAHWCERWLSPSFKSQACDRG